MAKILLHTLIFAPDGVSTAYLLNDLARQLRRLGHDIVVLTATPHYNLSDGAIQRQPLTPVWKGLLYKSDFEGIPVWHVSVPPKGEKISGRLLDYLKFHLISLLVDLSGRLGHADIVLAPSPPLTIGVAAWLLARHHRVPSIYNVQEIYPDFAINQGLLRNRPMIALMKKLERFIYARSSAVVTISDWFAEKLAPRMDSRDKLVAISNFVDTEFYRPLPKDNAVAVAHGVREGFVVLYAGNVGLSQDWESFLHAAANLAHLPIQFVVTGAGARLSWLRAEVRRRGLANVKVLGYLPLESIPFIYAASDVMTIPMKTGTTTDTFPSKIYTIMACGKPCVVSADEDSELAWLVRKADCGQCVPPDQPGAFADAILQAYESKGKLAERGMRGRRFVEAEYSKETVALKYDRLIRTLTGS